MKRDLAAWLRTRPDLDADDRGAILNAPDQVIRRYAPDRYSGKLKPYDPSDYLWSAAELYAAHPNECRECFTARPYPPGQRHFGWALWRDCDPHECGHGHHADEVWLA